MDISLPSRSTFSKPAKVIRLVSPITRSSRDWRKERDRMISKLTYEVMYIMMTYSLT